MADVIHRTDRVDFKLIRHLSVSEPNYPTGSWIHSPDLSGVTGVDEVYWKTVGDTVVAMDSGEQATQDAAILAAGQATITAAIDDNLAKLRPALEGIGWTLDRTGLVLTLDIGVLVQNDQHTATAHASLDTYVHAMLVHNTTSDTYELKVRERTGLYYPKLATDEVPLFEFGEWRIAPSGTALLDAPDGAMERNGFQQGRYIVTTASTIESITIIENSAQVNGVADWTTVRSWNLDTREYADDPPNELRVEARGMLNTTNGNADFRIKGTEYISGVAQTPVFYGADNDIDTSGTAAPYKYNKQPVGLQSGEVLFELQVRPQSASVVVDLEGAWIFSFRKK